jgi:hypothetical protein
MLIAVLSSLWELAALAGIAIGAEAWRVVSEPSAVAITDAGLETRGRLGRRRVIPWSSISEVLCRPDTEAPNSVRILSSLAQVRLTRRDDGFELVLAEICGRAPGLTLTRRVWHRG